MFKLNFVQKGVAPLPRAIPKIKTETHEMTTTNQYTHTTREKKKTSLFFFNGNLVGCISLMAQYGYSSSYSKKCNLSYTLIEETERRKKKNTQYSFSCM